MPPRILYAEDHADTRALVALLLRRAGFEVAEAASAHEALALAASARFELYLLDHVLPDASGVEVCKSLRAADLATPILFLTGRAMAWEREAALRAGAQGYLVKPDDVTDIAEHVARWVGPRHR
jgi:CheY-like chemotaxis protein